jgi:hypothetical protein
LFVRKLFFSVVDCQHIKRRRRLDVVGAVWDCSRAT